MWDRDKAFAFSHGPAIPHTGLAICCLCAFAYAIPLAWKALPFLSMSHPVRELNVTSSGKFSLIHPGSYLLRSLYVNVVETLNALMISLLVFPS